MGVRTFRPTDDSKTILNTLRANYGRMTPLEKSAMERRWPESWNPKDPIENVFDRLEDCYVQSITQPPAYTAEQMVDKALTAIQSTGLFPTAILKWNGFMNNHQTWPEFKSHFQEAYELQLQFGGFNGNNPYHGAANAFTDGDDSIEEINESITNIHRARNANTEATSTESAALCAEVASTRQALVATQQQMALMAQASPQMQAQTVPVWPPSYQGAYQQHGMPPPVPPTPVP